MIFKEAENLVIVLQENRRKKEGEAERRRD
jgi:hypothetical protein